MARRPTTRRDVTWKSLQFLVRSRKRIHIPLALAAYRMVSRLSACGQVKKWWSTWPMSKAKVWKKLQIGRPRTGGVLTWHGLVQRRYFKIWEVSNITLTNMEEFRWKGRESCCGAWKELFGEDTGSKQRRDLESYVRVHRVTWLILFPKLI